MSDQQTLDMALSSDVVSLLIKQHSQIRDMFADVKLAQGNEKQEAFDRLVRLLAVHETAEEEVVHPLTRTAPGGSGVAEDRLAEEHDAKEKLKELEKIGVEGEGFDELLEVLRHEVLEHARAEERYEFTQLRRRTSPAQLVTLAAAVRAAEATAPTHPHPGVESATANLMLGPFAAVADRVRDALRQASRQSTD
ncbi:hemerythrin domain-containing protein [Mycobacterium sp. ITM-2016-00317]|uniref:hemerythrin domain-containing protein n=1 Tax=Mycobacterium sp. ITM-2016-00317 TaxID=2099694 RepID=UPI00287FEEAE|nr:hemerythrin domain-containing protein [Mycobacterium sp. ITM-2016-00317]WNG86049.1 hemerythrin domain-containing protein [Mycobacterium sp. ITM-2016-00317]